MPLADRIEARINATVPKKNVKVAEYNLAKLGSKKDVAGINHSHERSVKKAIEDRKRSIDNANS